MFFGGNPVVTRTLRPGLIGTPGWAPAGSAGTTHDVTATIPSGTARKMVHVWVSDGGEVPSDVASFDSGSDIGSPIDMIDIAAASGVQGNLRCAAWYLDTPPAGAQTTQVPTSGSVWSASGSFVFENARAGAPEAVVVATDLDALSSILGLDVAGDANLLLLDSYSATLVVFIADGLTEGDITLSNSAMTTIVDDEVNSAFTAAYSTLTHTNSGDALVAATLASETDALMLVINIPFSKGQTAPTGAPQLVSSWTFDESNAATIVDQGPGAANLSLQTGTAAGGADPILDDGGNSVSTSGDAWWLATPTPAHQLSSYSIVIRPQVRAWPLSGNYSLFSRDSGLPVPGGTQLEYETDGAIDWYIRDDTGLAGTGTHVTADTGSGELTLDTGFEIICTFDGITKTASIYVNRVLLASKTNSGFAGWENNNSVFSVFGRNLSPGNEADGIVDAVEVWSGVLTSADWAGWASINTISDPNQPGAITASPIAFGNVDPNDTTDIAIAAFMADNTGPDYHVVVTGTGYSVINNDGATPSIRFTSGDQPSTTTFNPGTWSVAEGTDPTYGNQSGAAPLSATEQGVAGAYTPFPFVTISNPAVSHAGVATRPGYSPTDPRSASIIDPMSGIELFRVGGNIGDTIFTNGTTNSGKVFPKVLRGENNSKAGNIFNSDGTLMFVPRLFPRGSDPSGSASSYLIDVDGSHGASPWQIIRVNPTLDLQGSPGTTSVNYFFWDPLNPIRALARGHGGQLYEWWPIGGDGHSTGELNLLTGALSGYGNVHAADDRTAANMPSPDGVYSMIPCMRNSDGVWGGFRQNLITGALSGFIGPEVFGYTGDSATGSKAGGRAAANLSYEGTYTYFNEDGAHERFRNMSNQQVFDTNIPGAVNLCTHTCWLTIDGEELFAGVRSGVCGAYNIAAGTYRSFITSANFKGNNPNHLGSLNWRDTYETYGGTGSGASTGIRYCLYTRTNAVSGHTKGIIGVRTGPNDVDQFRYICNHRSVRHDNSDECHAQMDQDARYVLFPTNWQEPGTQADSTVFPMIAVLPDGWYSPNNDGS